MYLLLTVDSTAAVFSYPKGELKMKQDKKGLYSHPRWNDTSLPEIIGYTEPDPKEYEKDHEEFIEYLKKLGRKL